jgi:MFS transporter, PHS family, inorganic phosphate transporter
MALRRQLRVLYALDVARTQLYHFKATVIAGMGFFTDAYDFFAVSLVMDLISYLYFEEQIRRGVKAIIYGIALCGAVPGQLVFGWLGDKMGRKRVYGVTLVLMVVTSLASGLSLSFGTNDNEAANVVAVLCFFRFWLGFSIGGDYPLSATIMSEYANKRRRGAFIAAVFAMQVSTPAVRAGAVANSSALHALMAGIIAGFRQPCSWIRCRGGIVAAEDQSKKER